ncbi:hypothetical protein QAD02_020253 [Eretmocerus hayati]|uniref:Uncharacterized protein n=1 Tax=Eretmocerus hayati TaxID=131215 RepID=A0ACC2PNS7_9HYME|nr:hypothetical protein QAD02_020253 [Eretmocerus hayati]
MALFLQLLLMIFGGSMEARVGSFAFVDPEQMHNRCKPFKYQGMLQAQCRDLNLEDIPQSLQSDIEVLDVKKNRIREVSYDKLSRYSDLHYLYLPDNFVQSVPDGAFDATPDLEVLDLTKNGLHSLPKDLLRMRKLRNVYLSSNLLDDAQFELAQGEEMRAPLVLMYVDHNRLTRLPVRGPLHTLISLNVSDNAIKRVTVDDLAAFCSIKIIDLQRNPLVFNQSSCDCYDLREWARAHDVQLSLTQECPSGQKERCPLRAQEALDRLNTTRQLRAECMRQRELAEARAARSNWLWIATLVGAFVACVFLALCCVQQRSEERRRELEKEQQALGVGEHAALPCVRGDEVICCDERRPSSPGPDAPAKEHLLIDKGLSG